MADYLVVNVPDSSQFVVELEGQRAMLRYILQKSQILFVHTGVPPALEGRGIGSALVRTGLEYARANHLKVVSHCWFVSGYIKRHPEYQNLL